MQKNTIFYCCLLYIITHIGIINGTHFEGGTITYKILNTSGSVVSIVLTQTYIYDYTKIGCNNSMIMNRSPPLTFNSPYQENSGKVNCIQYCNQSGGYKAPSVVSYCTDYSASLGITVGQRSDTINITNGSYFLVAYQSSSWRQLTLPSTSGNLNTTWSIACLINLQMRPGGSDYNNPPAATIISPIYIPVGIPQNIFIPTIDADNDNVRCRFASGTSECGSACPPSTLPNGTILFSNCTLIITGAKINDWYAIAIQIEDFVNSTSTTPISSVPVQFLINVQSVSSCSRRPLLTGPVSQNGDCVGIQVGQTYVIQLTAENFCPNSTNITDIAILSFPIVTKTPIVRNTTTMWSTSLTWTPTASSVGTQILCAVAVGSDDVQSNQYCMSFTVAQGSVPTCPGEVALTTQATTHKTIITSQLMTTKLTTQVTNPPSSIATTSTTIRTTSLGTESTIRSTSVITNTPSTLVSSSAESSSSLTSWLSTTKTTLTSQSNFQYTTYTSLITTVQSTISSTTIQDTSVSPSSQDSSAPSTLISATNLNPTSQSSTSSTTTESASVSSSSQTTSTLSSWTSTSNTNSISESNFLYTTDASMVSTMQSVTSMISNFQSSLNVESSKYSTLSIISTLDASTSTLISSSFMVSSTSIVQQSSNAYQSTETTKSTVTSLLSSDSTSSSSWLLALLGALALLLITLCSCCCCWWYCCPRLCPGCLGKRRKKRPSEDECPLENHSVQLSTSPHPIDNTLNKSQYVDDDTFSSTRASSAASSRNADDIQLIGLTSPRKTEPIRHYTIPLQRGPRVAPTSLSPDAHMYGSRQMVRVTMR